MIFKKTVLYFIQPDREIFITFHKNNVLKNKQ